MTYISDLLGTYVTLKVRSVDEHGAYLYLYDGGIKDDEVFLPGSEFAGDDPAPGDDLDVFIYKDSEDRLTATLIRPLITLNNVAFLEVADVTDIGAFLQMGLAKDLFLPFKEQTRRVRPGETIPVALYIDKSERLAATMHLYDYLKKDTEGLYKKNDHIRGTVYEVIDSFGAFVIADGSYSAMIPKEQLAKKPAPGDEVYARITSITDDGKLTISLTEKKKIQIRDDAEKIYEQFQTKGSFLPFCDKTSPEIIKREFGMSKAAFKRAIGRLKKQGKIDITDEGIVRRD